MTTAQRMLNTRVVRAVGAWAAIGSLHAVLLFTLLWLIAGCGTNGKRNPSVQAPASPYGESGVVWAVAPVRNESGTSVFDELAFTDALVEQLAEVEGLVVLPTNRVIGAMRALGLASIDTPDQAFVLAGALRADGVIVATATAWDPYDPPKIGVTLGLFARSDRMKLPALEPVNPEQLQSAASEPRIASDFSRTGPVSLVSAMLDASDTAVRGRIRRYAEGRYDPVSALGWQRYTASMRLYAKFACFEIVEQLIASERSRVGGSEAGAAMAQHR